MKKLNIILFLFIFLFSYQQSADGANKTELTFDGKLSAQVTRDVSVPFPIVVDEVFVTIGQNVKKGERLLKYHLEIQDYRNLQHEISSSGGQIDLNAQRLSLQQELVSSNSRRKLDSELSAKGLMSPEKRAENSRQHALLQERIGNQAHKERISRESFAQRLEELENYFGFPVKAGQKLPNEFYMTARMGGTIISVSSHARANSILTGAAFVIGVLNPIQAQIEVHESEITKIYVGQPVTVKLVNDSKTVFNGKVVLVSWQPVNPAIAVPSYYTAWVDIENPDFILKPGYKVIVHVPDTDG